MTTPQQGQCGQEGGTLMTGKLTCTRPDGHAGPHRCENTTWGPTTSPQQGLLSRDRLEEIRDYLEVVSAETKPENASGRRIVTLAATCEQVLKSHVALEAQVTLLAGTLREIENIPAVAANDVDGDVVSAVRSAIGEEANHAQEMQEMFKEAQAGAAALREGLEGLVCVVAEKTVAMGQEAYRIVVSRDRYDAGPKALSSTAGREFLERLEKAESWIKVANDNAALAEKNDRISREGWLAANREKKQAEAERHAAVATAKRRLDGLEFAWCVIANAYGGDWSEASPEWRDVAAKWRDTAWHPELGIKSAASDGKEGA
jgi:hypothetical protein